LKSYLKYIKENNTTDTIVDIIKRDCQPFLEQFNNVLFRSVNEKYDFELVERRKDREPRTTDPSTHECLDNLFAEMYGWNARSDGVFVDGNKNNEYGEYLYMFFPKGNFRYLYNEEIPDLLVATDRSTFGYGYESYVEDSNHYKVNTDFMTILSEEEYNKKREEEFRKLITGYKTTGAPSFNRCELMFDVNYYYMLYCGTTVYHDDRKSININYDLVEKLGLKVL